MNETQPKRVLMVIPSLAGGGAERMVVNLCRRLDRRAWRPRIVSFTGENVYAEELPADVQHVSLGKASPVDNFSMVWRLAGVLRRERPDIVFSGLHFSTIITVLAKLMAGCGAPLVASTQNTLSLSLREERFVRLRNFLTRMLFPRIDLLVAASGGVKEDLVRNFGVPADRCVVIHNAVDIGRIHELMARKVSHPWFAKGVPIIISAGRLTRQKNYPLLLRAFAQVLNSQQARLLVLGEGEERERLLSLARRLGIAAFVDFPGFQANPFSFIGGATVFALSSDWEGFGNVVVEAMACGTPVVCTRYRYGAEEIITDGENGILVPCGDVRALSAALCEVLGDEGLRRNLAAAATKRAMDFEVARITGRYEQVFASVLAHRKRKRGGT